MSERPILFSGAMVRALLAGTKTQTRRVIKDTGFYAIEDHHGAEIAKRERANLATRCPYGQPGDWLYVREAFSYTNGYTKDDVGCPVWYWADGNPEYGDFTRPKPSIHMPRWASRILLEITGVRVERLHDISEADARAEGIADGGCLNCGNPESCGCADPKPDARDSYCHLWQSINGEQSWHANPWVWVVEFRMIEA